MALLQTGIAKSTADDYTIDQSLRFEDGDSAYLSRTPGSAGNSKTWSLSFWRKQESGSNTEPVLTCGSWSGGLTSVYFNSGGALSVVDYSSSAFNVQVYTAAKYRDPSAWSHYLVVFDSSDTTSTDRVRMYKDGIRETIDPTRDTMPSQDFDSEINTAALHMIGRDGSASSDYGRGYLAEMHFLDGTALTNASSFGEEDSTTGQWKPIEVTGLNYGINGFYQKYNNTALATSFADVSGNAPVIDAFTSTGSDTWTCPTGITSVEVLVVAGGGGGASGGRVYSGAGGGGGVVHGSSYPVTPGTVYDLTVGAGGGADADGSDSVFNVNGEGTETTVLTASGGGKGGAPISNNGNPGGSGGGGAGPSGTGGSSDQTTTFGSVAIGYGNDGCDGGGNPGTSAYGGGGGSPAADATSHNGAAGKEFSNFASYGDSGYFGGGGSSQKETGASGTFIAGWAATGGGAAGRAYPNWGDGAAGTANTGGGGAGAAGTDSTARTGGAGGSGVILIKYSGGDHTVTANGDAANQRPQPHAITANGNAHMLGAKVGDSAIVMGGASNYLECADSADFSFGTGDWTVDFWVNTAAWVDSSFLWGQYEDDDTFQGLRVVSYSGGFRANLLAKTSASVNWNHDFNDVPLPTNEWCHLALVRSGTTFYFFLNGILGESWTGVTDSGPDVSGTFRINDERRYHADFSGAIDEFRLSKGVARWTADFTPETSEYTSPDSDTKLLIHAPSSDNATSFTDSSPSSRTITNNSSNVRSFIPKIGAGAMAFDGSGDYLSTPNSPDFSFGSGDFTLEGWVKLNSTGDQYFLSSHGSVAASREFYFGLESSTLMFYYYYGSSSESSVSSSWTPSANTWYHVAVCRDGADLRLFVDGSQLGSTHDISTRDLHDSGYDLKVGALTNTGGSITGSVDGYLDEVRISRTARYTTTFTPSTTEFTDDINTTLLIHGDKTEGTRVQDKSTGLAISEVSRMSFDGSGDYLSIPASSDFEFSATDSFTLEGWVKFDSLPSSGPYYMFSLAGIRVSWDKNYDNWYCVAGSNDGTWSNTPSLGHWYHLAIVGDGSDVNLYIDGTSRISFSQAGTVGSSSAIAYFAIYDGSIYAFDGYMDEIRLSNSARYTSTFTPETRGEQFTTDANTKLLIHSDWGGGLGADSSGNYNTYTVTNLVATDVVKDSPSNNFCTFNPLNGKSEIVDELEEGNLRVGDGGGSAVSGWNLFSTFAVSSGKWYYEYRDTSPSTRNSGVGWCDVNMDVTGGGSGALDVVGAFWYNNLLYEQGSSAAIGETLDTNVIAGVAIDVDAGKVWFSHNGTWWDSQDPAAGSNPKFTAGTNPTTWMPIFQNGNDGSGTVNYGQDSSFAGAVTAQGNQDDNDVGDFYYSPPSGFLALCTDNLPDPSIADPTVHMNTILWAGDSTSPRTFTGVGFQPDWSWGKSRTNTYDHQLTDSVRGVGEVLTSATSAAEQTEPGSGWLSAFNSDGFVITGAASGTYKDAAWNESGQNYVGWNWKAGGAAVTNDDGDIDSEVSVNTTAGFSIVGYTGTGSATTVGHGLSQTPELILIKNRPDTDDWIVYSEPVGNTSGLLLSFTNYPDVDSGYFNDTSPTSSVFTVGTQNRTNGSTNAMIAYCFHSVEGYSKIGSYTGNGLADGPMVYTGFTPAYVIIKKTSAAENWYIMDNKRPGYNVDNDILYTNLSNAEADTDLADLVSNGIKIRTTDGAANTSTGTYIYWAFAETPFKTANAR